LIVRPQLAALLFAAVIGGILFFAAPLRAADPTPIACPTGQTIFVRGQAPPREALLLFLADRPVGGGLADASGAYSLPLRAQERPGSYPVEVRVRASKALVDRFTCFVDVPIGDVTETPTVDTAPSVAGTPTARPTGSAATTPSPGASRSVTPTRGTSTATALGGTPSATPTGPTATPSASATSGPSPTASATTRSGATATPTVGPNQVIIAFVVLSDPAFPDESSEYVEIENTLSRPVNLQGWQLRNLSRPNVPTFTFPSYELEVDTTIAVYSGTGQNDLEIGDFFWGQTQPIWAVGDQAELRDARGNLIHTYTVVEE
jgi:hypothetical protein